MKCEKTYKRETAIAIMVAFWIMVGVTVWNIRENVEGLLQLVNSLVLPTFMFASLAFGLDWRSKQGTKE